MSCHRARELIHSFIDGELDTRQAAVFRRHLDECEPCKLTYNTQLTLRAGLKSKSLYYCSPTGLRKRILASLRHSLQDIVDSAGVVIF